MYFIFILVFICVDDVVVGVVGYVVNFFEVIKCFFYYFWYGSIVMYVVKSVEVGVGIESSDLGWGCFKDVVDGGDEVWVGEDGFDEGVVYVVCFVEDFWG